MRFSLLCAVQSLMYVYYCFSVCLYLTFERLKDIVAKEKKNPVSWYSIWACA